MYTQKNQSIESHSQVALTIIVPTYNESENILSLIETVHRNVPSNIFAEMIIIDDNSPDGTGKIVDDYIDRESSQIDHGKEDERLRFVVRIIHRNNRSGLISAILDGIRSSIGKDILIMDADFSHPPELIPKMLEELGNSNYDLVVASRYVKGGSVIGWPFRRRIISNGATSIARHGLKIRNVKDPMSGFFICKRQVIENISFDTTGHKILVELLVKARNIKIKEIPYIFTNRKSGESKLDAVAIFNYLRAVWRLYRYGLKARDARLIEEKRKSVLFLSKAARFYTVGASGLLVNYLVSVLLSNGVLSNFLYIHSTIIGIICSIMSNFFLNKIWTFEDRNFAVKHTAKQCGLYTGFSSIGGGLQLGLVYLFVQLYSIDYPFSLLLAVGIASIGNFLLNKKWTFGEKVWG